MNSIAAAAAAAAAASDLLFSLQVEGGPIQFALISMNT